jgi:flagellar motor switch protein FliM
MEEILSKEEIRALFSEMSSGGRHRENKIGESPSNCEKSYPDCSPNGLISKDQVRCLQILYEYFSRNLASSLSGLLGNSVDIYLKAVKQISYAEFLNTLADPTFFARIGIRSMDGAIALELSQSLVFPMIDLILGGKGRGFCENRYLTEFELDIMDGVLRLVVHELRNSWKPIIDLDFFLMDKGPRMKALPNVSPGEEVIVAYLNKKIGKDTGMVKLCFSTHVLEQIWSMCDKEWNVHG